MSKKLTDLYEGIPQYEWSLGKSNILRDEDAIKGMMNGIEVATDLIRKTYGGGGSNVIVESRLNPKHSIVNDCWSIIKDIKLDDPAERVGLDFVKELVSRQDKLSGDSRKTCLLLLSEILKQGYEAINGENI